MLLCINTFTAQPLNTEIELLFRSLVYSRRAKSGSQLAYIQRRQAADTGLNNKKIFNKNPRKWNTELYDIVQS